MRSDGRKRSTVLEQARLDQFCAATIEVLAAAPHREPSLSAIAAAAGVSKGLILYHVTSRDDLLLRCYDRIDQLLTEHVEAAAAAVVDPDPWTMTCTVVRSLLAFMAQDRARCVAHSRLWELTQARPTTPTDPDGPDEDPTPATTGYDERDAGFVDLFRWGINSGAFRDITPLHFSAVVNGSIDSFIDRWIQDPAFDPVAAGEDLLTLLSHGLLRKGRR